MQQNGAAESPLLDQVRAAIRSSGLTRYRIAKSSGVHQSTLSRFMRHERGISIESLEKLGRALGLQITTEREGEEKNASIHR